MHDSVHVEASPASAASPPSPALPETVFLWSGNQLRQHCRLPGQAQRKKSRKPLAQRRTGRGTAFELSCEMRRANRRDIGPEKSRGGLYHRDVGFGHGVAWWSYGLTECRAVVKYLLLAFWPKPLVFDYGDVLAAGATIVKASIAAHLKFRSRSRNGA